MVLTDTAIKQAKPASKPYTLTDGDGLSLQVPTTGSRRWHFSMDFLSAHQKSGDNSMGASVLFSK
ncbi:Arm DNA-binding domain-containing protein [Pseudomonas syringae]|uniref:Arm DNA-binding domain-containing protein n=1 Tax=Pseudomonas syringae pv. actinidifoliorum ICMP 18803 TaxID=1194400 RepID=A0AAT9SM59_PSESX|nr:Arm DNA-binding domain-containing protein [Pseudomonas syringae]EPM45291.1 putative integrase [Pseudomonas syringae pv. actinidiae ICMP 19098]EPM84783.1 putative integrase [Pseudomonas syringae pv. actinidiae ICMP 18804]EPN19645.1 putative integrase [Pseudomonas syringae pv. actinidiae ICMP 19100]EPN24660.1 putative integrase [Pseudomonas syringae pv. actinidiae ICMP 19099]EPN32325.1 putative integrase [Pseudomonas syringae pv. actinidiae ICMP 18883]